MQKYKVQITDHAIADMDRIYEYIAKKLNAPQNARDQYKRIANSILSLDKLPERFALFEMEPEHSRGIRRMVVDNFLVCYIVDAESVTVTNVLYGASNVHAMLK